jgi:hypothetical protein
MFSVRLGGVLDGDFIFGFLWRGFAIGRFKLLIRLLQRFARRRVFLVVEAFLGRIGEKPEEVSSPANVMTPPH